MDVSNTIPKHYILVPNNVASPMVLFIIVCKQFCEPLYIPNSHFYSIRWVMAFTNKQHRHTTHIYVL